MDFLCSQQANHAMLYHIGELSEQCSLDFLIGGKGFRVFFGQSNLLTCQAALAFIQRKFQRRRKADIAGGGPFKGLSGMRYNTAAVIPVSCVLRLIAQIAEHFVACSVAMDGRKPLPVETRSVTASMNAGGQSAWIRQLRVG